ncbi:MAG TPA: NUDIX domain-containing protein [Bacillota bacterium]|nr:NUDIX domain-containing protein [Bacillota bacterium]
MRLFNLVMVFNQDKTQLLFCHREKDPYKGLFNLIGGKIENGEDHLESAYRELFEETGITKNDIELKPFMNFTWHFIDMSMDVFIGRLNKDVALVKEIHELHWFGLDEDFFDMNRFAGEGNIGHMMELYFQNETMI